MPPDGLTAAVLAEIERLAHERITPGAWSASPLIDPEAWNLLRDGRSVAEFHKSRGDQARAIADALTALPKLLAGVRALAKMDGHMSDCAYVRLSARGAAWCACDRGKAERDKALREFAGEGMACD